MLTLSDKIKVIDSVNEGMKNSQVAAKFGCGRTQIANILLNKKAIVEAYTNGAKADTKYLQPRNCQYPTIDEKVWQFYCEGRAKNMPINSALLKSEALEITKRHGYKEFSASNGWMDSFATRHQLKFASLHGESAGVDPQVSSQWRE